MVYGPGITNATVKQRAEFTVDARAVGAQSAEVELHMESGGRRTPLEATVEQLGENLFRVRYEPQSAGTLTAVVRVDGVPVREEPFTVPVELQHEVVVEAPAAAPEPQRIVDARTYSSYS